MPHPSTNYLIARVRDFIRWQEKMFGDPSARGAPLEDPIGWANDKEFWILNTVWRDTIFEGNADDSMAAADAFRAFAVSKSILSWKDPTPARFEEILSARHAATMQHATMQNGNGEQAPRLEASADLGEKLEQAVNMALNEVMAILGFSLDPDDRAFSSILNAKTTILGSVLNAQVRVDDRRFGKEGSDRDIAMEKLILERMEAAKLQIERMRE
jgi:hypothetical protein